MKVFKDDKVYVQLKDLDFLFNNGGYAMPQSIFKKALHKSVNMDETTKNDFVMFDDPKELEFFKSVKCIADLDDIKNMSNEEYNGFILSSKSKIERIKAQANDTNKYFELLSLQNKYVKECHKITSAKEARNYKKPSKSKKRCISIFKRRKV